MLSKIYSRGLSGIDGFPVSVETDISNGMPAFDIVGLPDTAVKEAKERVRSAIKNTGFKFPAKHIVINLAPASQRKEGSGYDLPMALSILTATEQLQVGDDYLEKCAFFGELSLDGSVNSINGILPMVISAYRQGITDMFVPAENAGEAAVIEGVNVYPVESLKSLCDHFCDIKRMEKRTVDVQEFFRRSAESILDFCDVKGQENVKRALEIAAAGNHNVLLIGSPGTGKTMLAQRMPSILPDLTFDEALEVTKIHSISGLLSKEEPLILKRPFRSPHHTISPQGLSGGGAVPKPGELSLAHNGILFLDELPEFRRDSLESLRQPLEDGIVTISRVSGTLTYPCNIMLISSMNPCKCGYLGDPRRQCTCTPQQINRYRSKISGPLLDRIDIQVEVSNVDYDDLSSIEKGEKSAEIKKRVNAARKVQLERYEGMNIYSNSQLDAGMLQKYCVLGDEENAILRAAFDNLGLSARAHSRILKVARTIADLEGSENIRAEHIAEAIQYRSLDRKYFE
ncbi:MAG: YifB family Mg chelatase-like AAA ATPase [Clostridia bacterium]|nr:YifB family Mg chelatase-like AAA ATPase [Clostridia bacterium]MBR0027686.1 YifB family Mg chelatase-like AAA ATPase [Clostridia bacterium]